MKTSPQVTVHRERDLLRVEVGGSWRIGARRPEDAATALREAADPRIRTLSLSAPDLGEWDTSLLAFFVQLIKTAEVKGIATDVSALPDGLRRLIDLAFAVRPKEGSGRSREQEGILARIGAGVLQIFPDMLDFLSFLGETVMAVFVLIIGRSRMRPQDFIAAMHECGVQALPIISVTTLLFGLILAFVGAVQLTQFGAQIYVAGLVGIGMLRVMSAVMVGIVMSGRVGASYAAMIGTMQVNEEVDALSTLGISPVDFLVLPRTLALTFMVPLLTVYADVMGVLGGYFVGVFMLGLNPLEYVNATVNMVSFRHALIGIAYGTVFGVIVAVVGCYQGMRCGRSAQAVGMATTKAVVQSLVGIIVATAIITVICNVLQI
ncbi:MAG: ABC transporter permease [Desulfovibrio sp.]|nr:ABC transporter permease [Desulfovibrio sp.]